MWSRTTVHPEVTACGLERWFIGHACEISATPDVSIAKLRQDTFGYVKQLELQAAKFWQAWLKSSTSVCCEK